MSKPAKAFRPMVTIANDLRSGAVVFRTSDGIWSTDIAQAAVAETPAAAEALNAAAQADQVAGRVVEPSLIEVIRDGAFVRPAALRELIRAMGPTIALPTVVDA